LDHYMIIVFIMIIDGDEQSFICKMKGKQYDQVSITIIGMTKFNACILTFALLAYSLE